MIELNCSILEEENKKYNETKNEEIEEELLINLIEILQLPIYNN